MNKTQREEVARLSWELEEISKKLISIANVEQSKLPEKEDAKLNTNQEGSKKVIPVILDAVQKIKDAQMIANYIAENSVEAYLKDLEDYPAKMEVLKNNSPTEQEEKYTVVREDEERKQDLYISYTINRKGEGSNQIFTAAISTRLILVTIADVQKLSASMLEIFLKNNPEIKTPRDLYCTIIGWQELSV